MSKKVNNLILIYVLIGFFIIYALVKVYQHKYTDNTLTVSLVKIDSSKVTKMIIYPVSEGRKEIKFFKDGKDWKLSKGKITCEPEPNSVQGLLSVLLETKTQRLASRSKSKWADFNLTDSAATRVKVYEGDKLTLDMLIGKFSYQPSNDPYAKMYGGGGTGTTYVRLSGEDESYAIDGFLSFTLNRQFNTFRNQTFTKLDKSTVDKVTFKYPGDSSFIVTLTNKKWMMGDQKADSAKVANYLNSLTNKNASTFDDDFVPSLNPQCQVIVEGKEMKTITVDAYIKEQNNFILNSNLNSKSWFSSGYKGLYSEIFKLKKDFLPDKKKK